MSENRICPVCGKEILEDAKSVCPYCSFELKYLDDEIKETSCFSHIIASIIGVIIPLIRWWGAEKEFIIIFLIISLPFGLLAGYVCYKMDWKSNKHLRFGISLGSFLLNISLSALLSFIGLNLFY